jgi:hypothetical protein
MEEGWSEVRREVIGESHKDIYITQTRGPCKILVQLDGCVSSEVGSVLFSIEESLERKVIGWQPQGSKMSMVQSVSTLASRQMTAEEIEAHERVFIAALTNHPFGELLTDVYRGKKFPRSYAFFLELYMSSLDVYRVGLENGNLN